MRVILFLLILPLAMSCGNGKKSMVAGMKAHLESAEVPITVESIQILTRENIDFKEMTDVVLSELNFVSNLNTSRAKSAVSDNEELLIRAKEIEKSDRQAANAIYQTIIDNAKKADSILKDVEDYKQRMWKLSDSVANSNGSYYRSKFLVNKTDTLQGYFNENYEMMEF